MTTPISHRRTHHLLLINRLLSLKESSSPFTLLLDSLSQSSKPLVKEYVTNASLSKHPTIFISFETLRAPLNITKFIKARQKPLQSLQNEITNSITPGQRALIIIDSLIPLCSHFPAQIPSFLGSLVSPTTSLVATYHLDVPLTPPPLSQAYPHTAPHPLTLLKHLSTTLITVHSINHILLQKQHRDQALLPPRWGLLEESEKGNGEAVEGVVVGLGSNSHYASPSNSMSSNSATGAAFGGGGIVLEMEHRRKSGRAVTEVFFLKTSSGPKPDSKHPGIIRSSTSVLGIPGSSQLSERIILIEDHLKWRSSEAVGATGNDLNSGTSDLGMLQMTTFDLGLTEKQRKARDEVILPYFDAQKEDGVGGNSGGGGMILFTPGKEDDFDDEEDEI